MRCVINQWAGYFDVVYLSCYLWTPYSQTNLKLMKWKISNTCASLSLFVFFHFSHMNSRLRLYWSSNFSVGKIPGQIVILEHIMLLLNEFKPTATFWWPRRLVCGCDMICAYLYSCCILLERWLGRDTGIYSFRKLIFVVAVAFGFCFYHLVGVSIAVTKHADQKQTGEERACLAYTL